MPYWGWPQWVAAGLLALVFLAHCFQHGTTFEAEWNIGSGIVRTALWTFILYMGGFFSHAP